MKAEVLKALKESIEHWTRLYLQKPNRGESTAGVNCALCQMFVLPTASCKGCPIYQKTRMDSCHGTPYHDAVAAYRKYGAKSKEFKAAALLELEFLKSLLPTKEPARTKKDLGIEDKLNAATLAVNGAYDAVEDAHCASSGTPYEDQLREMYMQLDLIHTGIVQIIHDRNNSRTKPRVVKRSRPVPWKKQ